MESVQLQLIYKEAFGKATFHTPYLGAWQLASTFLTSGAQKSDTRNIKTSRKMDRCLYHWKQPPRRVYGRLSTYVCHRHQQRGAPPHASKSKQRFSTHQRIGV